MRADRFVVSYISAALLSCGTLLLLAPALAAAQTAQPASSSGSTATSTASTAPKAAPKATNAPSTTSATATATKTAPAKRPATKSASAKRRTSRVRAQTAPTPARITQIQTALAAHGAYRGQPNGKWDDSTTQAMKDFQSTNGLTPTGKLDALTLQKLGLGSEIAGRAAPLPQTATAPASSQQQTP